MPFVSSGIQQSKRNMESEDRTTESEETEQEELEEKTKELSPINRRGRPARIRKKNKLFYDDEMVTLSPRATSLKRRTKIGSCTPSSAVVSTRSGTGEEKQLEATVPAETTAVSGFVQQQQQKEQQQPSTLSSKRTRVEQGGKATKKATILRSSRNEEQSAEKVRNEEATANISPVTSLPACETLDDRIGQKIGPKLRNLLKLPQAHKWVCHEWFYSNLDKCLFAGSNDFQLCLNETFPDLKCREMTRSQWTMIRRMIGKPRRCSDAFFDEERRDLDRRRHKLRALQQRKHLDAVICKDLPLEIPIQLTIGTKVTARLRRPQDGLFTGTVEAFDTSNNTYRITFERAGLGTHSIPDFEVLSNEEPETMTLNSITNHASNGNCVQAIDKKSKSSNANAQKQSLHANEDLDADQNSAADDILVNNMLNGYPIKLLELIVLVTKLLSEKKLKIKRLKDLNNLAERFNSYGGNLPEDFERKYASVMVKLEKINRDLQNYLLQIRSLCIEVAPEPSFTTMLIPSHIRERCHSEALDIMEQYLTGHQTIINDGILELIKNLTALLIVVRTISGSDRNAFDLDLLQATTEQIKSKLFATNRQIFEDKVEIHMQQIRTELAKNAPSLEF